MVYRMTDGTEVSSTNRSHPLAGLAASTTPLPDKTLAIVRGGTPRE